MAKSQQTFNKKEKEKKRLKKRRDKQQRLEERRANNSKGSTLDDMIAYVDENGNITDTPPDPSQRKKVDIETIETSVAKKVEEELPPIREGKVDFFNESKGFGFIFEQLTQEKYFVHIKEVVGGELRENDKVNFEVEKGLKGLNAVRVKRI